MYNYDGLYNINRYNFIKMAESVVSVETDMMVCVKTRLGGNTLMVLSCTHTIKAIHSGREWKLQSIMEAGLNLDYVQQIIQ